LPFPITLKDSFHNDLAIDTQRQKVYISDVGTQQTSAIVVVDLETGAARRVLQGHRSVRFENVSLTVEGKRTTRLNPDGTLSESRLGINPITISPNNEWVYFGAMHSRSLYRIRASDLADEKMESSLGSKVERYGDKPVSGGITVDFDGNVYITDLEGSAIGVTSRDGRYRRFITDPKILRWADGLSFGSDNYVYVVVSKLHLSPPFNGGKNETSPPYFVARFKGLASSQVGR
jgi:sugar lactone lactonase YvrE